MMFVVSVCLVFVVAVHAEAHVVPVSGCEHTAPAFSHPWFYRTRYQSRSRAGSRDGYLCDLCNPSQLIGEGSFTITARGSGGAALGARVVVPACLTAVCDGRGTWLAVNVVDVEHDSRDHEALHCMHGYVFLSAQLLSPNDTRRYWGGGVINEESRQPQIRSDYIRFHQQTSLRRESSG